MPNYQFDHIHLMSPDPLKTAQFYIANLGAKEVSRRDLGNGRFVVKLNMSNVTLLISKALNNAPTGLVHFGFKTENIGESVQELKAKGINFTQDIKEIVPGLKISYLEAPEKVAVELQEGSI